MKQIRFSQTVRTLLLALLVIVLGAAGLQVIGAQPLSAVDQGNDLATSATTYSIVDTGQTKCYNNSAEVTCPSAGQAFYGQDAQYSGNQPSYTDNGNSTVTDNVTGLMWQQTPSAASLSWQQAADTCAALTLAGQSDWRTPSLKELFSISDFSQGWPYLNTTYFHLAGADVSKAEQYWSSNDYAGSTVEGGPEAAFGVNHGTDHIKAYPAAVTGPMGKHVRCVRGDIYGVNQLVDHGDGTITDQATGLMWSQTDSGTGLDWEHALAYAQTQNAANYLGAQRLAAAQRQGIAEHRGLHPCAGRDGFGQRRSGD